MRLERRSNKQARLILTSMIVDSHALGIIAQKWDGHLFPSRWENLIGTWCVEHFTKYKKAPAKHVEILFDQWSVGKDKDTVKAVSTFLSGLSGEYKRLKQTSQTEYVIDAAASYFTAVSMRSLVDEVQADLEDGDIEKAQSRLDKYHKIEIGLGAGIEMSKDKEAMRRAFEKKSDPIIRYSGAMGNFIGDSFERNGFISFEGPEKRGKTWWLIDVAWRAMLQKRKVAFFEVGDLSEDQMMRRLGCRAAKRPLDPEPFNYPISIEPSIDGGITNAEVEERTRKAVTWQAAVRALNKINTRTGLKKTESSFFRLATYPARSISVSGISSVLQTWERQEWVPDVVVVDYADILAPINGTADTRDQINATWVMLRAMSMSNHCLVITATQTDADSYNAETIDMDNFSEDKRKRAHVTGSIGINQTDPEKEKGIYRLNWIVRRERKFDRKKCVHVAGCLALARPCILSTF